MSMCAFRTLDLGFEKDLTVILNSLNSAGPARQNVLLSATLTDGKSSAAPPVVPLPARRGQCNSLCVFQV